MESNSVCNHIYIYMIIYMISYHIYDIYDIYDIIYIYIYIYIFKGRKWKVFVFYAAPSVNKSRIPSLAKNNKSCNIC